MVQKVAIYCRVSTTDQSCQRQEQDLLQYAKKAGYEVVGVWKETASGTKKNRVERKQVMSLAQARKIDGVLVTELTRWGRSTIDLITTLQDLARWEVSVIAAGGLQFDLTTPQGKLIASVMASLAEFEQDLVRERVRSGLAAAKKKGKRLGRKPGQRVKSERLAPKVLQMVSEGYSYRKIARELNLSKTTVNDIVKRHRLPSNSINTTQRFMSAKKSSSTPTIYQLKISLKYIRPPIWRRVQVKSNITLEQLHLIIQAAMGWYNCHLHSWTIAGLEYGQPAPEYGAEVCDEKTVKLSKVVTSEKFKFAYTYDFGDCWEHEILVEKILPADHNSYPICLTGKRACPPEDCGGPWGYAELLSILNDPENPEYEERMDWLDGNFSPNEFDLKETNSRLEDSNRLRHSFP